MFVENRSNCFTFIIKWFSKLFNKQNDNSSSNPNPNPSPKPDIVIDIKQDVSAINIFDDITQDIIKDTTIEYDYVSPFSHKTCVNSFDDIIINNYDTIYHNLNVIRNIQIGNKLHVSIDDRLSIDNAGLQALSRYIYGDTRQKTLECINRTIKKAIKIDCFELLIDDEFIFGLNNLSNTYKNDENFNVQIQELINLTRKRE